MAERKRIDTGAEEYIGVARNLLAQLKTAMSFNKLMVLSRTVDLPGGVQVVVASVFGQDTITIHAPAALEARIAAAAQAEREVQMRLPEENREVSITVELKPDDSVLVTDGCTVTFVRQQTMYRDELRIYIAGRAADPSRPAIWDNVSGYGQLGLRNNERNGSINAISPDGAWQIGSVEIYDAAINPATTNPINGSGGVPYGWIQRAYVWKSGRGNDGNFVNWRSGDPASVAKNMEGSKIVGGTVGGKFEWDGRYNTAMKIVGGAEPATMISSRSKDGRVEISGNKYRLDGGAWKEWGPSGAIAYIAHTRTESVPYTGSVTTQYGYY